MATPIAQKGMDWRKISPYISTNRGCIYSTEVEADPQYRGQLRAGKTEKRSLRFLLGVIVYLDHYSSSPSLAIVSLSKSSASFFSYSSSEI